MLIMVINHNFYRCFSCRLKENAYLCTVFFIVLDLRLTKVGVRRYSFFLCQKKRMTHWAHPPYTVNHLISMVSLSFLAFLFLLAAEKR